MQAKGWNSSEILNRDERNEYTWFRGFFYRRGIRDFEELRSRDLALFTLGNLEGKKILDIGCGAGLYSLTFLKMGASFVGGQDIMDHYRAETTSICQRNGYSNFEIKTGDCAKLLFEDDSFDLAFSGDVFEHITDELKEQFIAEIYRVLKPGGIFTVKTPNKTYLQLSNQLKRIKALLKFKNPFSIHIEHTRNNPDNEHHGLTTYKGFEKIFEKTMFHEPVITYREISRKSIPAWVLKLFRKSKYFNNMIIMTVQKPIFYGLYK